MDRGVRYHNSDKHWRLVSADDGIHARVASVTPSKYAKSSFSLHGEERKWTSVN